MEEGWVDGGEAGGIEGYPGNQGGQADGKEEGGVYGQGEVTQGNGVKPGVVEEAPGVECPEEGQGEEEDRFAAKGGRAAEGEAEEDEAGAGGGGEAEDDGVKVFVGEPGEEVKASGLEDDYEGGEGRHGTLCACPECLPLPLSD